MSDSWHESAAIEAHRQWGFLKMRRHRSHRLDCRPVQFGGSPIHLAQQGSLAIQGQAGGLDHPWALSRF